MSIPANATEKPSIAKAWRQVKGNAATFAAVWGLILVISLIHGIFTSVLPFPVENISSTFDFLMAFTRGVVIGLPTNTLASLAWILFTVVPALYYTTDRCPKPGEIVDILTRRPLRYVLGGVLYALAVYIGYLLCIVPGILASLAYPLYVYYVFTTDLSLTTCLSKAFKGMFQDFGSYFLVSLLCFLAVIVSTVLCIFPILAVLPMTQLYMQNYIHHKGLVRARELA